MSALCQKQTFAALFDHLVGTGEQRLRNIEPERLGTMLARAVCCHMGLTK
jgi:hypothetical protein